MSVRSYRELDVWQRSMDLVSRVYRLSATLPDDEKFGLISQMRRAAVSVPTNIAEGAAREHTGDYLRFVSIALGSLAEVETLIEVAINLAYVEPHRCTELLDACDHVGRMLRKMQQSLKRRQNHP